MDEFVNTTQSHPFYSVRVVHMLKLSPVLIVHFATVKLYMPLAFVRHNVAVNRVELYTVNLGVIDDGINELVHQNRHCF